ncbi:MAG: FHA domain-containing protein [Gallionella sp.]|nr:FHA domain-containing protein [Gallionella sp.]
MAAKLILCIDGAPAVEHPLTKERMTIGRKAHNDIVIDNLAVSGEHAAIVTILHDSFLEDLDSTNGVEVNGARCKKHFLVNNDMIEIGKHKLKYVNDQITQMTSEEFERTMVIRSSVNQSSVISAVKPVQPASPTVTQTNLSKLLEDEAQATGRYMAQPEAIPIPPPIPTLRFDPAQVVTPVPPPATVSVPAPAAAAVVAQPVIAADTHTAPRLVVPQPQSPSVQQATVQILSGNNAGKELDLVKSLTTLGKPGVQVAVLTRRPHGFFITHVEGAQFPTVNGQVLNNQPRQLNDHDIIELAGTKMEFYFKV